MTDRVKLKAFPTAFKLAAIKRLEAGEAVLPLARKLGVSRKLLHDWRKAWKLHGPAGFNSTHGPKPGPRPPLQEHRARKTLHQCLHRHCLQHRAPSLRP